MMIDSADKQHWLKQIVNGQSIRTSYYLPQDIAHEVAAIIGLAMRTGKTVQLQLQDDALWQSIEDLLHSQELHLWKYGKRDQRIPLSTIVRWKVWLKSDLSSSPHQVAPEHQLLTYMKAMYAPIYNNHSWSDLHKMLGPAAQVMQLSSVEISGDPDEYRMLRRTIRRMMQIWKPQYQALLALQLFGQDISSGEQRLQKQLQYWYDEVLDCLIGIESMADQHDLTNATRLDKHGDIQLILRRLSSLYDRINASQVLAFKIEDTAHYVDSIKKYAIDICSRLRLGLDIINTEDGFLHWLHNYHRLDKTSQEIIDRLRLYPADRWASLLESWYFNEVLKQNDSKLSQPTAGDWSSMMAQYQDMMAEAVQNDKLSAARRSKQALQLIINQDDKIAHQLLRVESEQVHLTFGDIASRHPEQVSDLWLIDVPTNKVDIVISDIDQASDSKATYYTISKEAERIAQPLLSDQGPLTELPVARRLAVARALAYHINRYAAHLNLLVIKGKLVVSTISPRPLAQHITNLGRQFIRESEITDPIADITDHLLASDIDIEVWIEGPLIDNRKWYHTAQQYQLIQLLKSSGYRVVEIDDLQNKSRWIYSDTGSQVYDLPKNSSHPTQQADSTPK